VTLSRILPASCTGSWNTGLLGSSTRASTTNEARSAPPVPRAKLELGGKDRTPA